MSARAKGPQRMARAARIVSLMRFALLMMSATICVVQSATSAEPAPPAVENIAALRLGDFGQALRLSVGGYYSPAGPGGGEFIQSPSDTTSPDNGCTIIMDAAGHRFYRKDVNGRLSISACGARGDGLTDDTRAIQSAINLICHDHGEGGVVLIPSGYEVLITSSLSFKGCIGLRFGGLASAGVDSYKNATILWGGPSGDQPVLSVDQAASSTFENFTVYTYNPNRYAHNRSAPNTDIGIEDTEAGAAIIQTNTDNHFSDISIFGPPGPNSKFVGIRIGFGDTRGNVELATFYRVSVLCSETAPVSASSTGSGIQFVHSAAEPFATEIIHTQLLNCGAGFDIEGQISNLVLDGGASENNFTDLLINSTARGVVFRNFRSEGATESIAAHDGGDLSIDHVSFSALRRTGIDIQNEGQTIIDTVEFEDIGGIVPLVPNSGGSAATTIRNSVFPSGDCPTTRAWGGIVSSRFNTQKVGSPCPDFDAIGAEGHYTLGDPAGIGVYSSPKSDLCGWYQGSSGRSPNFAADCWSEQNIVGNGLNGTSTLDFSHSGTAGSSSVRLPALDLPHFLMGAVNPTIGSGFSQDPPIVTANGTAAFTITVGKRPGDTGVINLPPAEHGWICQAQDITTHSRAVSQTVQTASTKTSCTLTQFDAAVTPSNWVASDVVAVHAFAY